MIAPLAAIEALLKSMDAQSLPCNVRVLIGGVPPLSTLKGDSPLLLADKLAEFIRAHPGKSLLFDDIYYYLYHCYCMHLAKC